MLVKNQLLGEWAGDPEIPINVNVIALDLGGVVFKVEANSLIFAPLL